MRVHTMATKRNMAAREGPDFVVSRKNARENADKKLRKLPDVFNRFLKLPFRSDADVAVERPHFFRFVAENEMDRYDDVVGGDMRAYVVEIHPG
ncbi:hypothetical protein OROGR_014315 [Orobanche gracilis]